MSESRKIQASIPSPQIIRQPVDALAFMRRYDNIAEHRHRLLMYQRIKVPPSELVKLKLKKKAGKLTRTTNLRGEVAKNIIEQKKFEKGQKRDKPEQDIRIVGEPAPVNIYQQPAPGGFQFDPAVEIQRIALEERKRLDEFTLAQRRLGIEARQFDINKAIADREYNLQLNRLQVEDTNRKAEIEALIKRQEEEVRQFDILQEQRRKDRRQERKLLYEQLDAEQQLQEEARRQYEESRVIRLPGRTGELESSSRFLTETGEPLRESIPETTRRGSILARRAEKAAEQAELTQQRIDSRLTEFEKEAEQRRAQREAQFLTRGLSQVDAIIKKRFTELEQRQQQAIQEAEEEHRQLRDKIYDRIVAGLNPQGVIAQQIEGEVESAAQDIREAQRLENQQLRAEILDTQINLITASQLEEKLRREQAERTRLEQRLASIETDVARFTPGPSAQEIATSVRQVLTRQRLEIEEVSEEEEQSPRPQPIEELAGQRPEGTAEGIIPSDPGIATRAAEAVGETLAAGGRLIAEYFQAPPPEQETRGIGRPLTIMERAKEYVEVKKKDQRRPRPGEQTGGALVDKDGNPIYGLGQDFPDEFLEEIEIAEAQLAAKERSEEEQRQIIAAADAAEQQRQQQLRKAQEEAEAKARRIAEAQEESRRRNDEIAQIREQRLAQERKDLEQRAGAVLPAPEPEALAPAPQVKKGKPPDKSPTQPTGEVVRQTKPIGEVKPPSPVRVETSADVELTPERYQQLFRENKNILEANVKANSDAYKKEFADKFDAEDKRLRQEFYDKFESDLDPEEKQRLKSESDLARIKKAVLNEPMGKLFDRRFKKEKYTELVKDYIEQNRDKELFRRSNEYKTELNQQRALLRDARDRIFKGNYEFQSEEAALGYLKYLKQNKPPEVLEAQRPTAAARGQVEEVAEESARRAQVAAEGEALVEEAQGAGTEPQSAIRTNLRTYQTLLPEIQQLNEVGRPKGQRQTNIYIKNTSDKKLKGLEPGAETLITGYESQNNGTLGFFTEGTRKRTQKNVIEKLIKEGKIKIYKK